MISLLHEKLGHPSYKKIIETYPELISNDYIKRKLKENIEDCQKCLYYKPGKRKIYGKYLNNIDAKIFNEKICIDFLGPIDLTNYEHDYISDKITILVIIDVYTRYAEIYPIKKITSQKTMNIIQNKWIKNHGTPKNILCDQGKQFTSNKFRQFCEEAGIKIRYSAIYSPQSNGIVERLNGKILSVLRTSEEKKFKKILKTIWNNINLTNNNGICLTPYFLKTGKDIYGNDINQKVLRIIDTIKKNQKEKILKK